jgi:hypothetical protein
MKLEDYEHRPGFKRRARKAEADVRVALALNKPINAGEIARTLGVPLGVSAQWLGRLAASLGETKVRISLTGLPQ